MHYVEFSYDEIDYVGIGENPLALQVYTRAGRRNYKKANMVWPAWAKFIHDPIEVTAQGEEPASELQRRYGKFYERRA